MEKTWNHPVIRQMLRNTVVLILLAAVLVTAGCGDKEKDQSETAVGNWTQYRNRAYILLITNPKGEWSSSVRVADVTGKIVKSRGDAKGTWYIEEGQIIFTVITSNIETVWVENSTNFYAITELTEEQMTLTDESGRTHVWKQTSAKKAAAASTDAPQTIPMGPIAVNLNKNRSSDKDRYLCMNSTLVLNELMPDQEAPALHPKARDAALIFFSSLVFNDVKDFNSIKAQNEKLKDILNPYMEGMVKQVKVEHVIVAADIDKVEEFIIEHTLSAEPAPEEGEEGEAEAKDGDEEKT